MYFRREALSLAKKGILQPEKRTLPETYLKSLGTLGTKLGTLHSCYNPMHGSTINHYVPRFFFPGCKVKAG
jgi:hypothetical protein